MNPYVITFQLRLWIGVSVIGYAFYISLIIWDPLPSKKALSHMPWPKEKEIYIYI
jgi:hypothetical protein